MPIKRLILASYALSALGMAALAVMLIFAIIQAPDKNTNNNAEITNKIGGAFALTDMHNRAVSDKSFAGRYMLIYFGFSFCPDVCPIALDQMSQALLLLEAQNPEAAKKIAPLFITLDPERDTPAALRDYVGHFHPRLLGLSGTQAQITQVARRYRVYVQKVPDVQLVENYTIDHSSILYLMDKDGTFITHFSDSMTPEAMRAHLSRIIRG